MSDPAEVIRAQCNGILKDIEKLNPDAVGNPPNGICISPKDLKDKIPQSKVGLMQNETTDSINEVLEESNRESTETPNELIDKFSAALTMSLINSSVTSEEQKSSDTLISQGDSDAAKNETEINSTVVFPVSENSTSSNLVVCEVDGIKYLRYENETQMSAIMQLITKDLSEPYSIYTYRYFIHNWPHLCFLAMHDDEHVGAIVCKLDIHKKITRRGYIAMLAVDKSVRRRSIGSNLVKMAIETMHKEGCDEVVLETEVTNKPALNLYENLGFVRDKRLFRYYLNGVDALRLKLWL